MAPRMTFINVPVESPAAARTFFEHLGFGVDERFTDETCTCVEVSEMSYLMLLAREKFAEFTTRPVADGTTTGSLVCFSAESREDVDALVEKALAHGGSPAKEPMDYGFMYGHSFLDPDGHHWEVAWMAPEAVETGPAEYQQQTA